MCVDGRIAMFADTHKKADGTRFKYTVTSNIEKICEIIENTGKEPPDKYPLVVRIDSELFGQLEGVSRIFWHEKGASGTNPLEVAYNSALGRAIAQAGIGLIGTGVASAEEVQAALEAQKDATDQAPKFTPPANNVTSFPAKTPASKPAVPSVDNTA